MEKIYGIIKLAEPMSGEIQADGANMGGEIGSIIFEREADYNNLVHKPQIEGITLEGNKKMDEIGGVPNGNTISNWHILQILNS